MTTSLLLDGRADEKARYLRELRRESSVLPSGRRRDVVRGVADHLDDAAPEDPRPFEEILGAPELIARTAIRDHDLHAGRSLRPGYAMVSKRLQLIAGILYCPPAVYGLVMLALDGREWFLWEHLRFLLQLAPALLFLPLPLLARWKRWYLMSVLCIGGYVAYLAAQLAVNQLAVTHLLAAKLWFVPTSTVWISHAPVIVLLTLALLGAPTVLRHHRNPRHTGPMGDRSPSSVSD